MPPRKRPISDDEGSDSNFEPSTSNTATAAKKPRTIKAKSSASTASAMKALSELEAMSHTDLASYAFDLQTQLSQRAAVSGSGEFQWTPEKISERVAKTRDICAAEIKKQMKWQPKAQPSGLTPALYHTKTFFYQLFGIEKGGKAWKIKKVPLSDFQNRVGWITASIRYGSLRLTGAEVRIGWNKEEKTFTLGGTYGL
ncbi:hypothetical protein Moror_15269 [Moniliophthora roreri MCA 2997]|uniref:Uncharacterized protein n=1 Tax=Moniliophthora roreri (strain MCA 2997) TaxID=1381753 RepID=V2X250_MONRO|nr:hypothetical protein Moror_15269 [Moniliophthora roreri MCA 2997]